MDYHQILKQHNPLSLSEEKTLFEVYRQAKSFLVFNRYGELVSVTIDNPQVKRGLKAREKLILSNLRLVAKISSRTVYQRGETLTKDDLFSIGVLGLTKACDRFDATKNCKFSTYATYLIFQQIRNSLYKAFDCKISTKDINLYWLIAKTKQELSRSGQKATYAQIARKLSLSKDRVRELDLIGSKALRWDDTSLETDNNLYEKPYFDIDLAIYDDYKEYLQRFTFLTTLQKELLLDYIDCLNDHPIPSEETQKIIDLILLFKDTPFLHDNTYPQTTRNSPSPNSLSNTQSSPTAA